MILPPRQLFWRLLLWSGLLVWAVWKMRATDVPVDVPVEADGLLVLPAAVEDPAAPAMVDIEAALRAMDAAEQAARACRGGVLSVTLGRSGLTEARLRGGDAACVTTAVTGVTWPSARQAFEMERAVGTR